MLTTEAKARMNGQVATYKIKSDYNPARLFGGKRDEKGWAAWIMEGLPLKMRILVSPAGYRAEWAGPDGKERWRLVGGRGGDAHLVDWGRGTLLSVGKLRGIDLRSRIEVAWKDGRDPELGLLRRAMCHFELVGDESARLDVEALPASVGGFPSMSHLWSALVPWLGDGIESLGLPIGIRLELPHKGGGSAELRLDSLEPADVPTGAFDLPEGLKEITPNRHRKRRMPEHLEDGQEREETATSGEACAPAAGLGAALLTGMGPETVKVVFNQSVLDAVFADVGTATSYITGFSGTRFSFPTADWFDQVVRNAPVPANGQTSSVIPALMVRAFLGQICPMLRELGLSETNQDVAAAIEALPDTDDKRKLQEYRSTVLQRGLQAQFQQLLERVVPGLAPSSPATADDMACAELVLEDLGPPSRSFPSEPFVQLAVAWYGLLLPTLDVRPKHRTRKEIEDAVALFRANGEVDIDGLAELVDINLDAFEHSVTFGSLPLFTTPTYVDTAGLRTIDQRHPWFRPLQDIRFGFTTEFRLAGAAVSCGVDITPTLSAATVALAIFCPPCLLSLFMTGSASATVEDARFPVFLYVEQDPLRLNHPRWRAVFAEPQFGDVNASVVLIGFNWILALLMSAIGSVIGDFILEEILKSLGSELGDAADELLESVPLLDAGSIARLGHQPDLTYPPSEESRVAYDAPPRTDGGYQFETFRQASSGTGGMLEFPVAGAVLDADLALVLGWERAMKLMNDVTWPRYRGVFETRKPDGSLSQIDWWAEAPDQTDMPPRPPQAQSAPPSGVLLIPQNVGQSWWTFTTLLHVGIGFIGWRDLANSPANQPVADVLVHVWCRGEAAETEIIMYEECEDVTRLASGLLDPWRLPESPFGPIAPRETRPLTAHAHRPKALNIAGRYLHRQRGGLVPQDVEPSHGWADDSTLSYWFEPSARMPRPDDPGAEPVPGAMLCEYVVTRNIKQREIWVEASLEFPLPILIGMKETVSYETLSDFQFFPAISSALGEEYPTAENVNLNLFATGPLETLNRAANRDWIRGLFMSRAIEMAAQTGISRLGPFHYDYGIDIVPDLRPERFEQPLLSLQLESATTWPHGATLKNVAFKWRLAQSLLGRA